MLNGLWYMLVPMETIQRYLHVDRNKMCIYFTSHRTKTYLAVEERRKTRYEEKTTTTKGKGET